MPLPENVQDARQNVVKQIVEDMNKYQFTWMDQWQDFLSPRNAISGRRYNGGNLLHLACAARRNGYDDPRWITFNQAKDQGWSIKKGSKAAKIELWKLRGLIVGEDDDGNQVLNRYPVCVGIWSVFNGACVNGIPDLEKHSRQIDDTHLFDLADQFIASSRCPVYEDDSAAYYAPRKDEIHLPDRLSFLSAQSFLRTLLHEQCHSTGAPSALDRELSTAYGSEAYSEEELIAELGSGFIAAEVGLSFDQQSVDPVHYENHVEYLRSWISAIDEDPNVLFKMTSKASAAADYVLDRYNQFNAI